MKALILLIILCTIQLLSMSAEAFTGHEQLKVETIKPWGEFGFRAQGKGKNISEMRFDCAKTSEMGLVVTVVNNYGKSSNMVLPAGKLGADKYKCQEGLKNYFANVLTKRSLASQKDHQKTIELNLSPERKTLKFL